MSLHRVGVGVLAAATLVAAAPASAHDSETANLPRAPLTEAGYWTLADAMQRRLDPLWSERSDAYRVEGGGADTMVNGQMLLTHAVAAQRGHTGPSRNDRRARVIARRLVSSAPFVDRRTGHGQVHAPGWVNSLDNPRGEQHLVFDTQVVDGLVAAWRARHELALPEETVKLIEDRVSRTANGKYWRYPTLRLNQVNWYALMYAGAATVAGDQHLLRRDLSLQLRRFTTRIGHGGRAAGNLGPGGRFHYLPDQPESHPMNVDSAEYANIVMSLTRFLDQGRKAGMKLSSHTRGTLRRWANRLLAGYWTHAGYMNWDTGLGFERWHQAKKLGLTQEALIGLAQDHTLGLPARSRAWAKHILDQGLLLYERLALRENGIPAPVFFGVKAVPQGVGSARLAASRIQANAARAIAAGLGSVPSAPPPPLFAYDPDVGRLAISTPHYNTAVVPVNQRAFPYGGVELARLFDRNQDVAGPVAGRPPATFGVIVRDSKGGRVHVSQVGRDRPGHRAPVTLLRAPRLTTQAAARRPGGVFAGPFRSLKATGSVSNGGVSTRATHTFTARSITTTWTVRRHSARRSLRAQVLFPSHGPRAAIQIVLRDGRKLRLGRPIKLSRVRTITVRSNDSGYTVRILGAPSDAVIGAQAMHEQPSAPHPGPSLVVEIADGVGWRTARLTARVTPQPDAGIRDTSVR